jgi:hypothetical protein
MRALTLLAAVLFVQPLQAGWQFAAPVAVSSVHGAAIFHHLESANRLGVAVSDQTVAVAWEDNRSGTPHCHVAFRGAAAKAFGGETRLSTSACYEPVVLGIGGGRFVAAWEENGRVHARVVPGEAKALSLAVAEAGHVTLAAGAGRIYAAWAEQEGRFRRIVVGHLALDDSGLALRSAHAVESRVPVDEQAWPALAVAGDGGLTVAWEDRRHKHTVPMTSHSGDGKVFSAPARLSDVASGSVQGLGAGIGAMRPTLTSWGAQGVAAAWLDKRDFLSGYDVYAGLSSDGGRTFGRNLVVQDSFGDNMAQWHAQVVGNAAGRMLVVWDDERDGTPDVWMSEWDGAQFTENLAATGASGPGSQSDPVAALDAAGNLHLAWIERRADGGTEIRYLQATPR